MASKDITRTAEEAEAAHRGLVYNLDSEQRIVEIEDGFNLYSVHYYQGIPGYNWDFVYASKSDKQAIETALSLVKDWNLCAYVNRLILREDGEPSSIIIWGD